MPKQVCHSVCEVTKGQVQLRGHTPQPMIGSALLLHLLHFWQKAAKYLFFVLVECLELKNEIQENNPDNVVTLRTESAYFGI